MSCYRICQADLTLYMYTVTMYNIQKCDERQKSANHIVLYISLLCTCIHLYILVSTLVTPDFFSRFLFVTPQFLFYLSED